MRTPRVTDEGASEQPEHHPTYHVTGRHGCWATCLCGWKSATWREQNGAQLDFGQHLLMSTTTTDNPRSQA